VYVHPHRTAVEKLTIVISLDAAITTYSVSTMVDCFGREDEEPRDM
jgi:hypothetical protein